MLSLFNEFSTGEVPQYRPCMLVPCHRKYGFRLLYFLWPRYGFIDTVLTAVMHRQCGGFGFEPHYSVLSEALKRHDARWQCQLSLSVSATASINMLPRQNCANAQFAHHFLIYRSRRHYWPMTGERGHAATPTCLRAARWQTKCWYFEVNPFWCKKTTIYGMCVVKAIAERKSMISLICHEIAEALESSTYRPTKCSEWNERLDTMAITICGQGQSAKLRIFFYSLMHDTAVYCKLAFGNRRYGVCKSCHVWRVLLIQSD